jgi:hypothetical protein
MEKKQGGHQARGVVRETGEIGETPKYVRLHVGSCGGDSNLAWVMPQGDLLLSEEIAIRALAGQRLLSNVADISALRSRGTG